MLNNIIKAGNLMKRIALFLFIFQLVLNAQQKYLFQNPKLTVEERANDLVAKMTLEEKISQLIYNSPSIERLGIPAYNWWNECLHGVARNGLATVFPQAIGLASMWDKKLMYKVASAISDEARAKYNNAVKNNKRDIYQGLTFWSPNINIFRDPRWGRGMETYGEDPFLTGKMAVQFIKGLQGNDPNYFKVIATAKHFAVHSGPEPDRHSFNAEVSEYDLRETYLPAFKMSVHEGNVQSLMCAYNSLRGKACCGNDPLLDKILRKEWGFKGYVVSDCWAVSDIYQFHKQAKDAAEASALSVKAGTDLECGSSYPSLNEAIKKGFVNEDEINTSLKRLMEAKLKLGMFDPIELVPFSKIPMNVVNSKKHKQLTLEAARSSIVLLKNQGNLLPLNKSVKSIAVIGPNADDEELLLANYNGTPLNIVTPLEGIIAKVGKNAKVMFEHGCDLAEKVSYFKTIPSQFLFADENLKVNGLNAEYYSAKEWKGTAIKKIDRQIDFEWLDEKAGPMFTSNGSAKWSGFIVPPKTGKYKIGGYGVNIFKIFFDDSLIVDFNNSHEAAKAYKEVNLIQGKPYKIRIEYQSSTRYGQMKLIWSIPEDGYEERAIEAAKKCDVVLMFMGISPHLEGEALNVEVEGFSGGDRTSLDLPKIQHDLIKKIAKLNKPIVLVLLNGSALSINWEKENIPAIVEAWYGGEQAGNAIADVLFGDYNPSGKLPVTFYKSVNQLPGFKYYKMNGRTYRYFDGEVLFPFGYGLSYSKVLYNNLRISKEKLTNNECITLSVEITNNSRLQCQEVVQLYVKGKGLNAGGAIKSLKGFEKIELAPNQTKTVLFEINYELLSQFETDKGFVALKGEHELMVGSSSRDEDLLKIKLVYE